MTVALEPDRTTTDGETGFSPFPFPGLRPFRVEEADIFFGRNAHVDQLLSKLDQSRFVAVLGASGCGKSSLVRAGLIPSLETSFMVSAGYRWHTVVVRPGNAPTLNLAEGLSESPLFATEFGTPAENVAFLAATLRSGPLGLVEALHDSKLSEDENFLVVVDQFEEIFRFAAKGDPTEAHGFIDLLLTSSEAEQRRLYVVITMRSDFLGNCPLFRGLPEAMNDSQFLTPRLSRDQIREAIEGPVSLFQSNVEPEAVNTILNEMGTDPDQLPLMQHLLLRMWQSAICRQNPDRIDLTRSALAREMTTAGAGGIQLTIEDYAAVGGFANALSRHADEAFNDLSPPDQRVAEILFRCLSERASGQRDTCRPVAVDSVARVADVPVERVMEVAERFRRRDRSFITPPEDVPIVPDTILDISHESLIRQWDKMKGWVDAEAKSASMYKRLSDTAELWGEGRAGVWRTPDLENALNWRIREKPSAAWAERYGGNFERSMQFLDASMDAHEAELREKERIREQELRLSRQAAEAEKRRADEAEQRRREQVLANARLRTRAIIAALACVIAMALFVLAFLLYQRAEVARKRADSMVRRLYVGNGNRLMEEGDLSGAALWYAAALERDPDDADRQQLRIRSLLAECPSPIQLLLHEEKVFLAAFDPTGRDVVATVSGEKKSPQVARIWDVATGKLIGQPMRHEGEIQSLSFSRDGSRIVTGSKDGTARIWNATSGEAATEPPRHDSEVVHAGFLSGSDQVVTASDNSAPVRRVVFSPNGRRLADISGKSAAFRDLSTGEEISIKWKIPIDHAEFSPDGRLFLTANGKSGVARIWDAAKGREQGRAALHESLQAARFSPDGAYFATASVDKTVRLWDARTGVPAGPPLWHSRAVRDVAFSPDGTRMITACSDKTARVWSLVTGHDTQLAFGHDPFSEVTHAAVSPDEETVVTVDNEGSVIVWNAETGEPRFPPMLHGSSVTCAAFSPDGDRFVTAGKGGVARFWNPRNGEPMLAPVDHGSAITSADFCLDGSRLVTRSSESVKLWDLDTSAPAEIAVGDEIGPNLIISPNTQSLLTFHGKNATIWDLEQEQPIARTLDHHYDLHVAKYSPRGDAIVTGDCNGNLTVWEIATGRRRFRLSAHQKDVVDASYSHDGQFIVSISLDGTARVWLAKTGSAKVVRDDRTKNMVQISLKQSLGIKRVIFSSDDAMIATASHDKEVRVWDSQTGQPITPPLRHDNDVRWLEFSANGERLLTRTDSEFRLWDLTNKANKGEPVVPPSKHIDKLKLVTFVRDGQAMFSLDNAVHLYRLEDLDEASALDLLNEAQRVSSRNLDPTESLEYLTPEEMCRLMAGERSLSDEEVLAWRRHQAEHCIRRGHWFGAVFHLDFLITADQETDHWQKARDRADEKLKEWQAAGIQ